MKKTGFFSVMIISLLLTACQRETDFVNDNTTTAPVLLKKFVLLDPAQSAPNDTLIVSVYSYDAFNRCTSITSFDYQTLDTITAINFYNGADTVIRNRKVNYSGSGYDWEYFSYNASGQMTGDSIVTNGAGVTFVYKYQLTGNNYDMLLMDGTNNIPILKANYQQTRNAANDIIAEKDSSFQYNQFAGDYFFDVESLLSESYDTHPNPFYRVYPKRLVMLEFENAALDDFYVNYSVPQSNNILEEKRTSNPASSGLDPYHNTYTYQYNSNGYPASVSKSDLVLGITTKGVYIY